MNPDLMEFIQEISQLMKEKIDEYADTGTHQIALFCTEIEFIYFDSFGFEHVSKETEKFIEPKNIKTNIFRIRSNNSIMCGYFCIGFIDVCK